MRTHPRDGGPAVLRPGHGGRRRHDRGRGRHQQAHALQPLSEQGRADRGLPAAPRCGRSRPPTRRRRSRSSTISTGSNAPSRREGFRGCAFVNAVAELKDPGTPPTRSRCASRSCAASGFATCWRAPASPIPTACRCSSCCWSTARSPPRWCARTRRSRAPPATRRGCCSRRRARTCRAECPGNPGKTSRGFRGTMGHDPRMARSWADEATSQLAGMKHNRLVNEKL